MELADLWGGLDQEVFEEVSEKLVLSQTGVSEGEILACEPAGDNSQGTYTMRTSTREGLFEQMGTNEAGSGGIPKEGNQAAESNHAELRVEGENTMSAAKSIDLEGGDLDRDTMCSEKPSFHQDIKTERQTESAGADTQEEAFQGSASIEYSLRRDGEPGTEEQMKEEDFSLGREPDPETNREEDHPISETEAGREGQVSQEEDNWITETTNTTSEPADAASILTSEDRAVADMDVLNSNQDAPIAEVTKKSFSRQHGSQVGQQTSSETRLQDEDILQDQGKDKTFSSVLADLNLFQHIHLEVCFIGVF